MTLPEIAPMEAKLVAALPAGAGWQFEPKWDGFRCIAARDGGEVRLASKSGKPLARYFPEVVALFESLSAKRFMIDGELIIEIGETLSFDALQMRLHPAASRIAKLSRETPAMFMAFDLLADDKRLLLEEPLEIRRGALEHFVAEARAPALLLSPQSRKAEQAQAWLDRAGGALDGVIGKRLAEPYRPGERAMVKVKQIRTADCIVAGFRHATGSDAIGSLLLGLVNEEGMIDHVGFTSAIKADEQDAIAARLKPHIGGSGFTGKAPGGPSRWSTERSAEWTPLAPELVVEVRYDQVTARRFRHGTSIVRWRPDKAAMQCTMDQLQHELGPAELAATLGP